MTRDLRSLGALAVLGDDLRRQIYAAVRREGRALTRDEVAAALGISRRLAAFHLDKLLEQGLLRAYYARPPGRSGPGAGRSAKYYQPSDLEIQVSIPERRYDLAGKVLLDALAGQAPDESGSEAARRVARERGLALGRSVRRERALSSRGAERGLDAALDVLARLGFEPVPGSPGEIVLGNCPFHELAEHARDLVCGMNREFIGGLVRGLEIDGVQVSLEPVPGFCCVRLRG